MLYSAFPELVVIDKFFSNVAHIAVFLPVICNMTGLDSAFLQLGFALLALIWEFDFPPFMVLIIAILNDGKTLFIARLISRTIVRAVTELMSITGNVIM